MLVGLAVGDALGAPVEFGHTSDSIRKLGDKIEHFGNSASLPAGAWTDDSSMALCLADSLLECEGYDSYDIMDRYYRWVTQGYRSFDSKPAFDVGTQTLNAITRYCIEPTIPKGIRKTKFAGNGSIMRLAPVIIANYHESANYNKSRITTDELLSVERMAILSCRETHNSIAAECVTGMFATALFAAIRGFGKFDICAYAERGCYIDELPRANEYDRFWLDNTDNLINRWRNNQESKLRDLGGHIVDSFAIAMWGFYQFDNFRDGMLAVIRLGGDTDTNAAIYGQLAGAFYGYGAIPEEWKDNIIQANSFVKIADKLLAMKKCPVIRTRFEDDADFKCPDENLEKND